MQSQENVFSFLALAAEQRIKSPLLFSFDCGPWISDIQTADILVRCPYCNIVVTANLLFVQKHPRKVFLLVHRNDVTGRDPRRIRKQRSHVLFYEISSNAI